MGKKWSAYLFFFLHLLALDVLYTTGAVNFLFLHSVIELVAIVVSAAIFIVGWETFDTSKNSRFLILSLGYLGVAILDTLHTLAYKGMGVFPEDSANLPTQLWMAARFMEGATFLYFSHTFVKPFHISRAKAFWVLYGVVGLSLGSIFTGYFPDCFIEGKGLTPFKVAGEYAVSAVFLYSGWLLWKQRKEQPLSMIQFLVSALLLKVLSEMSFTLYTDVYGLMNYLGHLFKFFSALLVYEALVQENLKNPFQFLFQEVANKNRALEKEIAAKEEKARLLEIENAQKTQLLREVHHRIKNNLASITGLLQLKRSASSSPEVQEALQETIGRLQTMATLYTKLLISTEYEEVDGKPYLEDLLKSLEDLYAGTINVRLEAEIVPFRMEPKRLFLVGVMVNELVTNACKYAFTGIEAGWIKVRLEQREGWIHLFIMDNGSGFKLEKAKDSTGYGIQLVEMLSNQLKGWCSLESEGGTRWEIAFPL